MELNFEKPTSIRKLMFILGVLAMLISSFLISIIIFDWNNGGGPTATTSPPSDKDPTMTSCPPRGIPTYSIGHLAASGHVWNATIISGGSWISLVGQTGNTGKGFISYKVMPNYSPNSRFATIQLDGYNFVLEQEGNNTPSGCPAQLTRTYIYADVNGGSFRIGVDNWVGSTPWTVDILPSDTYWISAVQNPNLLTADIIISPNAGNDRITYITVAGTKVPIIQDGIHASN